MDQRSVAVPSPPRSDLSADFAKTDFRLHDDFSLILVITYRYLIILLGARGMKPVVQAASRSV